MSIARSPRRPSKAWQQQQQARLLSRATATASALELLRATLNAIPDMVWLKDPQGAYLACNPAFERCLGASEAAIVGKTDHHFFPAELAARYHQHDQNVMLAAQPVRHEEWVTLADNGQRILVEITKTPLFNAAGALIGVLGLAHDMTRRETAAAALAEAHAKFRGLSEASFESIFISERGICLEQNQSAERTFGYTQEDARGRAGTDWIAPADRALVMQNMLSGHEQPYEVTAQRKDGSQFVAMLRGKMMDYGGRRVRVTSLLDISAQKQTEHSLQRQTQLLASFFDMPFIGMALTDPLTKRWLVVNDRLCQMLGYQRDEMLATTWVDMTHPDDLPAGEHEFTKVISGQTDGYSLDKRYLCKDGQVVFATANIHAVRGADGTIDVFAVTVQDITERKQSETALRIAATAFESQEGMMIMNSARVILRVNSAFCAITGYSAAEAVGQGPELFRVRQCEAVSHDPAWDSVLARGVWEGEIPSQRRNGEVFPTWQSITAVKGDGGAVSHYVTTLIDITHRKSAEDEIKHLAFYDPLTHLPNRRLLLDRLRQALITSQRTGLVGALLFIDLDNFKTLNDTLGHDQGDALLALVAHRLSECVRREDTVARLGGDEFVIMLEGLSRQRKGAVTLVDALGEKILTALNVPYQLRGGGHRSTPSIGVALFHEREDTVDDLLKRADLAMYQAKAAGRNTLRFFDPQMQAMVFERAALESELRQAIAEQQFVLHYQVQVDEQGQAVGVEALVRWQHPRRGLVGPLEFIHLAEETGLILPIGLWVLETACRQLVVWSASTERANLSIAVNVSARQFHQADFAQQVAAVLARTGANATRLKLELTESVLVNDVVGVVAKMMDLKTRGVSFSLDDFGIGYSSLGYLKRLPLDQLKIDQTFVRDVLRDTNDAAIARTVVALGQSLGLTVIAEGVETQAQRDLLASLGCHHFQGYYFGRPCPVAELAAPHRGPCAAQ